MSTLYSAYLEVEGDPHGRHTWTYLNAVGRLHTARIGGHLVEGIVTASDEQPKTRLPHFGYDHRCNPAGGRENGMAVCEMDGHEPEPWGVWRYFGVTVVMSAEADPTVMGKTYRFTADGRECRLIVCGFTVPDDGQRWVAEVMEPAEIIR